MKPYFCNSRVNEMPFVLHFATALDMNQNTLKAKYILNAVFQMLRGRIPFFASDALMGHLPKDVQPLFEDNWPHTFATDFDYDEFINALYESSHIENVCSNPLDFITNWEGTLNKEKEYYIHCAGGYRSMIAASLLKRKGFHKLIDVDGGFGAIEKTGVKTVSKACASKS